MNPFAKKLSDLRHLKGVSQKALALAIDMDQTYLCAIEAGRKSAPRADVFLQKVSKELGLSNEQENELALAVKLSQQKYVIPISARPEEYALVHKLMSRIGVLQPAKIAALNNILDL